MKLKFTTVIKLVLATVIPYFEVRNQNYLTAPRNQRTYFITDSTPSHSNAYHHQAYMAFSDYQTIYMVHKQ
jgi:hypothetical protein